MNHEIRQGHPYAVIVGGSLGGLLVANALRAVGWQVTVFERSTEDLSARGAGLGATSELFQALQQLGAPDPFRLKAEIRSRVGLSADGSAFCELAMPSVATAWDTVYGLLRRMLPAECYQQGKAFKFLRQIGRRVHVGFSEGDVECDLLVGADGLRSSVRAYVEPASKPIYAGYVAFRGSVDEAHIHKTWHELLLERMTFSFPPAQLALTVPMPGKTAARRCQFSWFCPVDQDGRSIPNANPLHLEHDLGIASPQLPEHAKIDVSRRAHELLPPQVAHVVDACPAPLLQPIFDHESRTLVNGRVVLVGDAAFVARPHVGTGATKAALDAMCLANALRDFSDLDVALRIYETLRLKAGSLLVRRGRYLGSFLAGTAAALPDEQKRRLIREFGAAGIVDNLPVEML